MFNVPEFRTVDLDMSPFQNTHYERAFALDSSEHKSIYGASRQASLFVFPDGSWGPDGLAKFTRARKDSFVLSEELVQAVKPLEALRGLSVKYAHVVDTILKNKGKKVYVYCSIVNGSGAKLLAKILETYGYRQCRGSEPTKDQRYILLTGDTPNINSLIGYYNGRRNVLGEYCQVVIGSKKISEGFSFFDVQIELLLTFHWNYTETSQALRRALRFGSHRFLKQIDPQPTVRIQQLAAVPAKRDDSVDLIMLSFSVRKDISIKRMERLCQESAFDCPLTYERNRGDVDGSRQCNYQACAYQCDSVDYSGGAGITRTDRDFATFELYYSDFMDLVPRIAAAFAAGPAHSFAYLKDVSGAADDLQLLKCLTYLIENNVVILNSYGYPCFLREHANMYFLAGDRDTSRAALQIQAGQPVARPLFSQEISLRERTEQHAIDTATAVLRELLEQPPGDASELSRYLARLPRAIRTKFVFAAAERALEERRTRLVELVLGLYGNKLSFPRAGETKAVYEDEGRSMCLKRAAGVWEWFECKIEPVEEETYPPGTRYVGITEGDKFCIRELAAVEGTDKRKRLTGAVCEEAGWKKSRLLELVRELDIRLDGASTKSQICKLIQDHLAARGLVRRGKCGTARKRKV